MDQVSSLISSHLCTRVCTQILGAGCWREWPLELRRMTTCHRGQRRSRMGQSRAQQAGQAGMQAPVVRGVRGACCGIMPPLTVTAEGETHRIRPRDSVWRRLSLSHFSNGVPHCHHIGSSHWRLHTHRPLFVKKKLRISSCRRVEKLPD